MASPKIRFIAVAVALQLSVFERDAAADGMWGAEGIGSLATVTAIGILAGDGIATLATDLRCTAAIGARHRPGSGWIAAGYVLGFVNSSIGGIALIAGSDGWLPWTLLLTGAVTAGLTVGADLQHAPVDHSLTRTAELAPRLPPARRILVAEERAGLVLALGSLAWSF